MKARRVSLDHKFLIKALVAFVVPEKDFTEAEILIRDIGAVIVESKGGG